MSAPNGMSVADVTISGANDAIAALKIPRGGNYEFKLTVTAKRRSSSVTVKLPTSIVGVDDDWEPFPD